MTQKGTPMTIFSFESHVQTILTALLLAGIIWTMSTLQGLTVEVAELRVEVSNLKAQIAATQ